jgi:hypothetical protein
MKFESEAELARVVVAHLREDGWDVYQEVEPPRLGATADIVATRGPVIHVIECKMSLSLSLLGQALGWLGMANQVSVAVPQPRNRARGGIDLVRRLGLGYIEAAPSGYVRAFGSPSFLRRIDGRLRASLCEQHKTFAEAGNAKGHRFTPFANTRRQLEGLVRDNPGVSMKDAIDAIQHHYSSDKAARATLSQWIRKGVITTIEARKEGRALRLYPTKPTGAA